MRLKSLITNRRHLEIAEVELELIPGIPQIHFLGLPDRVIKESFYRIKSALKSSGYKFPLSSQVIVNIKPSHLRKSSRGVELAIALGILAKTKQIAEHALKPEWIIYGELGLDGRVHEPGDLRQDTILQSPDLRFLTGNPDPKDFPSPLSRKSGLFRLSQLESFKVSEEIPSEKIPVYQRPTFGFNQLYHTTEAEFLYLAATSGLHGLLAGESGAGKSTLAKALHSYMTEPNDSSPTGSASPGPASNPHWRPLVNPHQSITLAAFLGGGAFLHDGELERAQGGLLILDEMLEFQPEILEALRGPMTGESLRLARSSQHREVQTNFQVIATTNLCPCGKWTPRNQILGCRFSRLRCTRYLQRLSGPILDRFGILYFVQEQNPRNVDGLSILQRIFVTRKFLSSTTFHQAEGAVEAFYRGLSTRRKSYLLQAAKLYALERVLKTKKNEVVHDNLDVTIELSDLHKAEQWTVTPFKQLEKGMG